MVALGHEAFGGWLKALVDDVREEQTRSRAALLRDVESRFAKQVQGLRVWVWVAAVGMLSVGLALGWLLGR